MQWIIDNWLTLALVAGMVAMHAFGHGHGGHGSHGSRRRSPDKARRPDTVEQSDDDPA